MTLTKEESAGGNRRSISDPSTKETNMTTVSTNTDRSDRSPGVSELFDVLERLHIAEERPDAEIAAELGITTQRLRRWFQKPGELTFDNLIDLSVAFGMGKFELIELWCQQMDDAREIREAMS